MRIVLISLLSLTLTIASAIVFTLWKENYFSPPIVGKTYEDCGPYRTLTFHPNGLAEIKTIIKGSRMTILGVSHESYPYQIIDGKKVTIQTPLGSPVYTFNNERLNVGTAHKIDYLPKNKKANQKLRDTICIPNKSFTPLTDFLKIGQDKH